ncbi:flippase [Pseudoramibacter faecis]|uniref:flippase n=1 Tax=Pseudoramibacter faecis TaxID=3108534 RepID=UPI002E7756B7|nr:flippase [Pseudoramibacter sp. HA2172]
MKKIKNKKYDLNLGKVSIKRNFLMNSLLTLSSFIFPMITFPYISRILLPAAIGRVSYATSLVVYFNLIAQLGIPTYGIRACAQVRDDKLKLTRVVQELFIINLLMSGLVYILFFGLLVLVPQLQDDRMLYIVMSSAILFNALGIDWMYQGLEQYAYITKRSILFKFFALIMMFAFIHQPGDYIIYGGISIFASSASNILNFMNARKFILMKYVGGYQFKRHFRAIGIFFAMSCATIIYTNLDTIMLKWLTTNIDVGYYNTAVRVKTILVGIVTSLGAVLLPRASYYVENQMLEDFRRVSKKAINFVVVFASPISLYFILFAKPSIYLLSSSAFAGAIKPMQIIMPTVMLIGITNILGIQILVPLGRQKIIMWSEIAGAGIDFLVNWLLIPKYASAGAAFGTLLAEIIVLVIQFVSLRQEIKFIYRQIYFGKIGLALLAGCIFSFWALKVSPVFIVHFGNIMGNLMTLILSFGLFFAGYIMILLFYREPMALYIKEQITGFLP